MRAAVLLLLAVTGCASRGVAEDGGTRIRRALETSRSSEAVLMADGCAYYLGPHALGVEQHALRAALADGEGDMAAYLKEGPEFRQPLADDSVVAVVRPEGSYEFNTDSGFIRVRRAATSRGKRYWLALERGRWTYHDGPFAGVDLDSAWDRLVRSSAAAAAIVLDPSPLIELTGLESWPDGTMHVRAALADLRAR